jgi:arylsulfatase A-like enzyme
MVLPNQTILTVVLIGLSIACAVVVVAALCGLCVSLIKWPVYCLLCCLLGFAVFFIGFSQHVSDSDVATRQRPNIFLIGMDSLRPDFLSFFGHENKTPFLNSTLQESAVFSEAVTPLARTFPSWASILTGLYPKEHYARSNLTQPTHLNLGSSLPNILQKQGYETIYATDEVRFSNIDTHFGFDRIISPPIGLNDFLIGNFNDFPMSNLLINTTVGKWMFPHSYANRPVYHTYEPDSFLRLVDSALQFKKNKPLFLAIHFCLPHYPYLWANINMGKSTPQKKYANSIIRLDQQLKDFFDILEHYHLLDHAIVVLLSDHGEALALSGDRVTEEDLFVSDSQSHAIPKFYQSSLDHEAINQSVGHGTDVLGLSQYHTLLAFRLYGGDKYDARVIPGSVSLLDIKPTLLEFLNISDTNNSGVSLASVIKNSRRNSLPLRHIFIESDFTPQAIRTVYPEERQVLLEGVRLFQVDPITTRLTVKNEMMRKIINSKQYADIYDGWILALYPQDKFSRMPILVNLRTGQWTNNLNSSFALDSPAREMLAQLKLFYEDEVNQRLVN